MPKMYISKYAITKGVLEIEATPTNHFDGAFRAKGHPIFRFGRDIFASRHKANADAAIRVKKKIKSLEKQIEKLKAMNFD